MITGYVPTFEFEAIDLLDELVASIIQKKGIVNLRAPIKKEGFELDALNNL